MVPTGTPELPEGMLPLAPSFRHVVIFTLSSHDIAFDAWNWENVGEAPLNKTVRLGVPPRGTARSLPRYRPLLMVQCRDTPLCA
jgi:hypothetical protein